VAVFAVTGVLLAGLCLGCFQGVLIFRGLSYCLDTDDVYKDSGSRFAVLLADMARTFVYGLALLIVSLPFIILWRRTKLRSWMVGGLAAVVAAAGGIFVVDYTTNNQIAAVARSNVETEKVAVRCPGHRPPWWPF
jgi:hypothetical protein